MFFHNLKHTLITLAKNKTLLFWTYAFPIILGLLFNFAFSGISEDERLNIFDIAIVNNEEFNNNVQYKNTFESLGKENENQLFNIKYTNEKKAKELLANDKITGYLLLKDSKPEVFFKKNGVYETILKSVVGEIENTSEMMNEIVPLELAKSEDSTQMNSIINKTLDNIKNQTANIVDKTKGNIDYITNEYYSLIAMACMYGAMIAIIAFNQSLANMSNKGKRIAVSPTKKSVIVLSSAVASFIASTIGIGLLFLFLIYVVQADFGNNIGLIILLSLAGILSGTSFGTCVASTFKTSEGNKFGIALSVSMAGSFFAGMMGVTLKYIIDTKVPFINMINPVNMITDGFYSLYYFDTLSRYYTDLISLCIFSFICIFISYMNLRRQKYDSI